MQYKIQMPAPADSMKRYGQEGLKMLSEWVLFSGS
jgi:hypothetical protein